MHSSWKSKWKQELPLKVVAGVLIALILGVFAFIKYTLFPSPSRALASPPRLVYAELVNEQAILSRSFALLLENDRADDLYQIVITNQGVGPCVRGSCVVFTQYPVVSVSAFGSVMLRDLNGHPQRIGTEQFRLRKPTQSLQFQLESLNPGESTTIMLAVRRHPSQDRKWPVFEVTSEAGKGDRGRLIREGWESK